VDESHNIGARYSLEQSLGSGRLGRLYRARDLQAADDGPSLVRLELVMAPTDPDLLEANLRELAQRLAEAGPTISPIEAIVRSGADIAIVTPLHPGQTLRALLRGGALAIPLVAEIGRQVAEALARCHAIHLPHRDLQPEKLKIWTAGEGLQIRILDLGLAAFAKPEHVLDEPGRSASGSPLIGRLQYLSPEAARGREIDARADLYALGVTLYEASVGRPPFIGESRAVLQAIEESIPVRPALLRSDLPRALDLLIVELLAKDPARRNPSASDVAERLSPYADRSLAALLVGEPTHPRPGRGLESPSDSRSKLLSAAFGRDRSLRAIDARLSAACGGSHQLVLLGGEPGMGKTTLLDELAQACHQRKVELLRTSATAGDAHGGYLGPFVELLTAGLARRPHAANALADDAADLIELFPSLNRDRLAELAQGRPSHPGLIAELSSTPLPQRRPGQLILSVKDRKLRAQERIERLVVRAVAALVTDQPPLALAIDDVHECPAIISLIETIFRRLPRAPLLIVIAHQLNNLPTHDPIRRLRRRLQEHPRCLPLVLEPLRQDAFHGLLVELLDGPQIDPRLAVSLHRQSGGQPLFARELVRATLEHGLLIRREGTWQLDAPNWPIPRTLRAVLAGQLSQLSGPVLSALRTGSILAVGLGDFELAEVERLHAQSSATLELLLAQTVRLGMLTEHRRRTRVRYAFTSEVLRRVIHDDVPRAARHKLHYHCAQRLRRLPRSHPRGLPGGGPENDAKHGQIEDIILIHLIEAERLSEARPLVLALGQRALKEDLPEPALAKLTALLEVADALPVVERAELRLLAAELERLRGDAGAASAELQRLGAALGEDDDPRLTHLGERGAELARSLDRPALADRLMGLRPQDRRSAELDRRARIEIGALRPASASRSMPIGDLHCMHGEYAQARVAYESARGRAAARGDREAEARQLENLARTDSALGQHAAALARIAEGLELLGEDSPLARVGLVARAVAALVELGSLDLAEPELERGDEFLRAADAAQGDRAPPRDWLTTRARVHAELEHARGDWELANRRPELAIVAYERCLESSTTSERWGTSDARLSLGRACAHAGRAQRALREFERAASEKQKIGDRQGLVRSHVARVRVLRDLGKIDDAGELLRLTEALADASRDPSLTIQVCVELGRHALLRGRLDEAEAAASRARLQVKGYGAREARPAIEVLLGAIALARGAHRQARDHARTALDSARRQGFTEVVVEALLVLAEASLGERPQRLPPSPSPSPSPLSGSPPAQAPRSADSGVYVRPPGTSPNEARSAALLNEARAAADALRNPYRSLDVTLLSLRLGLGAPDHAGDDYVAIESLAEQAEALHAARHVGLSLLARAEVLAPIDLRSALEHARLAESRLRRMGALAEAELAAELVASLVRSDRRRVTLA